MSDTAVILATAMSKRCTQDLPVVNTQGSSTGFLFIPTIRPLQKNFFKYFFSGIVDHGVPFSIILLSSSAFLGFRKALEQDGYALFG